MRRSCCHGRSIDAVNTIRCRATYVVLVNTSAAHAPPLFVNLMDSALYVASRAPLNDVDPCGGVRPTALPLTVRNHPLPLTGSQALLNRGYNAGAAATLMMIVLSAIPASIAYGVVRDRETGIRRAMDLCGLSPTAYWLTNYVVDALLTLVTLFVCLGLYAAFGVGAFTSLAAHRLEATVVLMVLYAAAMPPQTYVLSRAFRSASSAQTSVFLINVVCVGLMISECWPLRSQGRCGGNTPSAPQLA